MDSKSSLIFVVTILYYFVVLIFMTIFYKGQLSLPFSTALFSFLILHLTLLRTIRIFRDGRVPLIEKPVSCKGARMEVTSGDSFMLVDDLRT